MIASYQRFVVLWRSVLYISLTFQYLTIKTLSGKKYIALAITEAFAGSDVSGLQTTAVREGDDWVITGTKKYV